MGELIIAGQRFDIDAPVINWYQSGWDATAERCLPVPGYQACPGGIIPYGEKAKNRAPRRYALRPQLRRYQKNPPLDAVKAVLRQFVLHHDGCMSAAMCWNVLHNERGLSCHFLIDNDGTIYQTIDLAFMAYHAAEYNVSSIGVEFCNRGDKKKYPGLYEKASDVKRTEAACVINGYTYLAYDFTKPQYTAFAALARALTRLLPNLPVEYPQKNPGEQAWETLPYAFGYAGYLGHYHCTRAKWDPGPFDLRKFCKDLRGTFCFPLFSRDDAARTERDRPEIPKRVDALHEMSDALYAANERRADGGFFPVGPWGEHRLWHGGVHLAGKKEQPVFAPFPGRIVAGRMGGSSAIGSTNFLLLRHDLTLGAAHIRFFTLYMHLADQLGRAPLPWAEAGDKPPGPATPGKDKPGAKTSPAPGPADPNSALGKLAAAKGKVVLLDEPVDAATLLGHMGTAGPDDVSRAQLHLELFSTTPLFTELEATPWELVDGTAGGRFCDVAEINTLIDSNRDGKLDRKELTDFYGGSSDDHIRFLITLHVSEWTAEPDWKEALKVATDLRDIKPAELDALVDEQITPGLWWTDAVARHAGLPGDGAVYHYHPIAFIRWFNEKLLETGSSEVVVDKSKAQEVAAGITDDFGDEEGAHAVSVTEINDDACDKQLDLADLASGFEAPECDAP
ncbi:MAG: N-acetylmuramoyl-L-alanine amidase [Kofleriaceae bacterium]|nr:N-acetylmuramoyl-L-alanine amidase [Kofleriaceae bacterium]